MGGPQVRNKSLCSTVVPQIPPSSGIEALRTHTGNRSKLLIPQGANILKNFSYFFAELHRILTYAP